MHYYTVIAAIAAISTHTGFYQSNISFSYTLLTELLPKG